MVESWNGSRPPSASIPYAADCTSSGTGMEPTERNCGAGVDRDRARGIHTLRHCFASHLMEDGVALPVIQQLLGHTSLKTTSVYCHVSRALLGSVRSPADMPGNGRPLHPHGARV